MKELVFSKKLFGGIIDITINDTSEENGKRIIEKAYFEGLRLEKIFNFYDSSSEISKLNKSRKLKVSKELLSLIKKSLKISDITNGTYDISLGKTIMLRKHGKIVRSKCSYKDIIIKGDIVTLKHKDVQIDLGSLAKGHITDKMGEVLEANGIKTFIINSRGDILVKGERKLGIQNPRNDESIGTIKLKNQGVATTGDYKQYAEEYEVSHVVYQKKMQSVTVIAKSTEEADLYATAIFTASMRIKLKLLENTKIKVLIVEDGKVEMHNGFEKQLVGKLNLGEEDIFGLRKRKSKIPLNIDTLETHKSGLKGLVPSKEQRTEAS